MTDNSIQKMKFSILALCVSIFFCSCFGSKPISYFNNGIDTTKIQKINIPEPLIQKGDILGITIYSDNPEATAIYNQASGSFVPPVTTLGVSKAVPSSGSSGGNQGYLVDNSGNVFIHKLGTIKAEGFSKDQVSAEIVSRLNSLGVLTNPYCVIRFNNYKITVLGEVKSPGVFTLPSEKASVLEAVGLAGDITDYGLKDRIVLVRENQGNRTYHRINLLDPEVFSSPFFYLRQNDVIIVQADTRKPTALDQQTLVYITLAATLASTAAIIISIFK